MKNIDGRAIDTCFLKSECLLPKSLSATDLDYNRRQIEFYQKFCHVSERSFKIK